MNVVDHNRLFRIGAVILRVVLVLAVGTVLTAGGGRGGGRHGGGGHHGGGGGSHHGGSGSHGSTLYINALHDLRFSCVERSETIVIEYSDYKAGQFEVIGEEGREVRLSISVSNMAQEDEFLQFSISNDQCAYSRNNGQTWHKFSTGQLFHDTEFPSGPDCRDGARILVRVGGTLIANDRQHRGDYEAPVTLTVTYLDCLDTDGCTYSQGYWKNHSNWPFGYSPDMRWFGSYHTSWQDMLQTPPRGNKNIQLAHQYIAAVLNIANGASANYPVNGSGMTIQDIVNAARAHFEGTSSIPSNKITKYKDYLDDYNNGLIGPGHCD